MIREVRMQNQMIRYEEYMRRKLQSSLIQHQT